MYTYIIYREREFKFQYVITQILYSRLCICMVHVGDSMFSIGFI